MILGAALLTAPVSAQEGITVTVAKVDVNKLRANIAKSDAEIANAKKAAKAATWLKRGATFIDVDAKPVNGIYASMPEPMLTAAFGKDVTPTTETVGAEEYTVYPYEHFKAYLLGGVVDFFTATTVVDPAALDKAYDAYAKAYEIDAKQSRKVADGMSSIRLKSFENGGSLYKLGLYNDAATNFRRAYRASTHPSSAAIDTLSLYYAGMSSTFGEDNATALVDLEKAIEMGYYVDGETFRLKFLNLYGLDRKEESLEALKTGLAMFPTSEGLIDMTMRYYAENEGDPSALIPMVQEAISKNPQNPLLYQGLARTYDKLGQIDNAIETIKKAVELAPNDFLSIYLQGWFIVKKGDEMYNELGNKTFTSNAQYQQAREIVYDVFRQALAPLEKAYTLNQSEVATVELLKNLTYRLREDEGMTAKNEKYDALFKAATGQQ
jgi:tetratricopeptide (TPR) repeat protein